MLSQTSAYYSKACLSINMLVFYIIFITKNNKRLYAIEIMLSQKMANKICLRSKFEIENKIKTELSWRSYDNIFLCLHQAQFDPVTRLLEHENDIFFFR